MFCGDNGHKWRFSFKTLVSKNAATWWLVQTSITINLYKNFFFPVITWNKKHSSKLDVYQ